MFPVDPFSTSKCRATMRHETVDCCMPETDCSAYCGKSERYIRNAVYRDELKGGPVLLARATQGQDEISLNLGSTVKSISVV